MNVQLYKDMKRTRRFSRENSWSFKNHQNVFLSDLIGLEIGLGERLDIAGFDSILTSEMHSASISEASKLKNFPGGAHSAPQTPSCLVTCLWIINELNGSKLQVH